MSERLAILLREDRLVAALVGDSGDPAAVQPVTRALESRGASPRLMANVLGELAAQLGASRGAAVAMVLDSRRLGWRRLAEPPVRPRYRRQALASAYEAQAGQTVEQFHLAIGVTAEDGQVTVAAAERAWLSELLAALEEVNLRPDLILPEAELLARLHDETRSLDAPLLVSGDDTKGLLVHVVRGQAAGWGVYGSAAEALQDAPRWALALGLEDTQPATLSVDDTQELATAARLLDEASVPLNLCSGPFRSDRRARRLRRHAVAALLALAAILAATGAALWREATTAEDENRRILAAQAEAWRTLYPNEAAPAAFLLRLESDVRRLRALTGETADAPAYRSARAALERVLANLPVGMRLDIAEISIDQRDLSIRGETDSHAEAERIARALDEIPGLRCPPPRSDVLGPGRVVFVIHASLTDEGKEPPGAPR